MSELKTIYLHGALKEQFGESFKLAVNTPIEALRALAYQLPDFRKEFEKYDFRVVKGELQRGWHLDEETVSMQIANDDVHFIPHIAGAGGKKGLGKIITGIVLIGLAFTGVGAALGGIIGMTKVQLAIVGGLMVLGGMAQMKAKTPQFSMSSMEPADRRPSFVFTGAANVTEQGNAIPLVYGRLRVGSQVVAQGMDTINT